MFAWDATEVMMCLLATLIVVAGLGSKQNKGLEQKNLQKGTS